MKKIKYTISIVLGVLFFKALTFADSIYGVSFEDAQRIAFQTGALRQSFTNWEDSDWNDNYYPDAYHKRTLNDNLITPGWNTWDGKWRYYDVNNIKWLTGWQYISGDVYYFYENGDMATNTFIIKNDIATVSDGLIGMDGRFIPNIYLSGWHQDAKGWRYYDPGTHLYSIGWKQINDAVFYFYENGYMAANTLIDGKVIDDNGKAVF